LLNFKAFSWNVHSSVYWVYLHFSNLFIQNSSKVFLSLSLLNILCFSLIKWKDLNTRKLFVSKFYSTIHRRQWHKIFSGYYSIRCIFSFSLGTILYIKFFKFSLNLKLKCCGISGPNDWDLNAYYNCSSISTLACSVPASCCFSSQNVIHLFLLNAFSFIF
jgi:hypothetical protein